jgi:MipA family protein
MMPCRLPILALLMPALALAQQPEAPEAPAAAPPPPPQQESHWEGAIGPIVSYSPEYQGGQHWRAKVTPGFFLRYGRFTVTNTGGFVTRRADDVVRGVAMDLTRSDTVRVNVALRFDRGRSESSSSALTGLGDVKQTIRARLLGSWRLPDGWRLGASWSVDAFGRGGGNFGDVSFGRELRLSPDTVWSWGGAISAAGDRYMQTYFGVDEEQAARTGYPVYQPSAGLRDVSMFANMRTELSPRWVAIGGISASRLIGPAAASPLTKDRNGWGINGGIAWRF